MVVTASSERVPQGQASCELLVETLNISKEKVFERPHELILTFNLKMKVDYSKET